ncbi:hypothetical protein K458DRAFT_411427 [Lentithecium fluviatile CBS 122367]|uniref:Uncharacterized protein n=1 Tax=Lentithecium fluviatile CBS 122367 TaxID=1168545 RepID=A0A6G1JNH9_9PLEO|nr:hypothetical protein K458DRAFT_411427 [Lentithecium fluviatile CBS 122367]
MYHYSRSAVKVRAIDRVDFSHCATPPAGSSCLNTPRYLTSAPSPHHRTPTTSTSLSTLLPSSL